MSNYKTLFGLCKNHPVRGVFVLLAVGAFIALVTVARILQAYGDFRSEAFSATGAIVLFIVVNVGVIGAVIAGLVALLKPPRWVAYAFVVVLSFPVIVAAPIGVAAITGTAVPGKPESIRLSDVYNPWETWLRGNIDRPVKQAKAREIKALVRHYRHRGKAGKRQLLDRLNESLASESLADDDMSNLEHEVKTILTPVTTAYPRRLRQVARKLFAAGQRGAVRDLAR